MQRPIEDIKRRLLTCIDPDYNVTDMAACLDLISKLEKIPITREVLESTRLGKYINDIRRKTSHQELYRRAKDLVRKWRKDVLADGVNGAAGSGPGPGGTGSGGTGGRGTGNGHPPTSPSSLPSSGNTSPLMSAPTTPSTLAQRTRTASPTLTTAHTSRPLKPVSPALRGRVLSPGLSPAMTAGSSGTTPPIATPTRSRSRPHSPAVNPSTRQPSRADASSYAPSIENVSKNNTANKRLRKDDDETSSDIPVSKRPKNNVTNGFDEDSRDSFSSVLSNDCASKITTSGGSECSKNRRIANAHTVSKKKQVIESSTITNTPDPLRQKMAAIPVATKSSKVKTTSQIVAELAVRKGDTKLAERASKLVEQHVREIPSPGTTLGRTSDHAVVTRNKMDHMRRFLSSQPDPNPDPSDEFPATEDERSSISTETEDQGTGSRPATPARGHVGLPPPVVTLSSNLDLLGVMEDESAEEILARLPPLDLNSIVWDDPDEQVEEQEGETQVYVPEETKFEEEVEKLVRQSKKVPADEIKTLHSTNLDCQNGNFDMDGKFREWHEVINKKGYQDDPLIVLPYVITDF